MNNQSSGPVLWSVAGFFVVIAFGVGIVSMAAFDSGPAGPAAGIAAASAPQTVNVELGDLYIKPGMIHASAGSVTFKVTNKGATEHNFSVEGLGATPMIPPGSSKSLTVQLETGTYKVICQVPGHAGAGMTAQLMVAEGEAPASDGPGAEKTMSAKQMALHDAKVTGSFPAETEGIGGTALEPRIVDGVKVFDLTASVIKWEVSPGEVKEAWAYNEMVPGPQINVDLGDRVRIVLHNELPEPT
ncbi:MAG: hypothetical protein QOH90_1711, partial [Actinomycetota bacterium]|nr:hypothetical protein [Actinomycetota bacterium]